MEITRQLAGRKVRAVGKYNDALVIMCDDGYEVQVAWVDENGKPVKGQPMVMFAGKKVVANLFKSTTIDLQHQREQGLRERPR
jgi:hypothetical protein